MLRAPVTEENNIQCFFIIITPGTSISRPGDRFVSNAIVEATSRVNSAVNSTLSQLFDRSRHHTVSDLIAAFRSVDGYFLPI